MPLDRAHTGRAFLLGVLCTIAFGVLVAAVVVWSGIIDVAATRTGPQDSLLEYAAERSLLHHAPDARNPRAGDPSALKRGFAEYRAMCLPCHGGPGVKPKEFAAGLHPAAPDLSAPELQRLSDGLLYRVIEQGIGSTGMPAFGPNHSPDVLWAIVAFVRQLPALSPQERAELAATAPPDAEANGLSPDAGAGADAGGSHEH